LLEAIEWNDPYDFALASEENSNIFLSLDVPINAELS
jgi:hypothetical protein